MPERAHAAGLEEQQAAASLGNGKRGSEENSFAGSSLSLGAWIRFLNPNAVLALQRTAGNAALSAVLELRKTQLPSIQRACCSACNQGEVCESVGHDRGQSFLGSTSAGQEEVAVERQADSARNGETSEMLDEARGDNFTDRQIPEPSEPWAALEGTSRIFAQWTSDAVVARQHDPGGPYHPPEGTELGCSMTDECPSLSLKINYLVHTIKRHREWDLQNPMPEYPQGRHAEEIADLERALERCKQIAQIKCRGQPVWVPEPSGSREESTEERLERIKAQIRAALPYALALVVIGLVVACVIAEPCGAAVVAALAVVLGATELAMVLGILRSNSVPVEGSSA